MGKIAYSNGKRILAPDTPISGKELKTLADIKPDRLVTVTEPGGQTRAVRDDEQVVIQPNTWVSDVPVFEYGA